MRHSKWVDLTVAAATLAVATSACGARTVSLAKVRDCGVGKGSAKPSSLTVSCADANSRLTGLKWSYWGANSATAKGSYAWNPCRPSCVSVPASKWHHNPATAQLSKPYKGDFQRLVVHVQGALPKGAQRIITVSEKR